MQEKFETADRDENGSLSQMEFNTIFRRCIGGQQIPMSCTNTIFEMLDTNSNGKIEFSEFKAAMLRTTVYLQH